MSSRRSAILFFVTVSSRIIFTSELPRHLRRMAKRQTPVIWSTFCWLPCRSLDPSPSGCANAFRFCCGASKRGIDSLKQLPMSMRCTHYEAAVCSRRSLCRRH